MKVSQFANETEARIELEPTTVMDKAFIEGLGNVTTAVVKRNGILAFVMTLPQASVPKPTIERPRDETRDSQ